MAPPIADEEGMGPLERGRRRYQQKDYSGSLSAFTEAVNMSSGHMKLTALDHRAAAQEKLQKFQPALSDAKRMIDLKPALSKVGYLRCGKVLQLKGNPELALKIYERGLGKVKIGTDDERTMLQRMYNKTKRALAPKKVLDPLVFLPLELAEMVCQHLTMRDRVICLAVSKPWKRLLESSHKLWTTLDTTFAKKSMNHKSLKAHLKRSNYTLDHAIITLRAGLDLQKMTYITSSCKNLRRLEIRGSGVIGESLTKSVPYSRSLKVVSVSSGCAITPSAVHETLTSLRKTITEAYFMCVKGSLHSHPQDFPRLDCLKILQYKAAETGTNFDIHRLINVTPNLESVAVNNWIFGSTFDACLWPKLQQLDLTDTHITLLPDLPPTLKHLILNNNGNLRVDIGDRQFPSPPLLETFACAGTTLNNSAIKDITRESIKRGNLKTLLIGRRLADSRGRAEDDYPASETVEELSLASLWEQEHQLIQIVSLYPNVRKLDVSSTKATGVAVKAFVQMGVQYLKLNECSEVGIDAVEWARGQGVAVEFNFPSRSGNARVFRDSALATGF
ncbi:F-box/TPR repeat protein [Lachnellula subtilissima]|uniref:F-box/TPR repeat protein n=1 Tax=Lachnellula subtilissima TaxID=602034 RepID=A0A8H8U791_9HELO|nr:F-box/TPR repeat protein [Lachnellula subtilissima]